MEYRILFRRADATEWAANNPVLKSGEPGYERDTRRLKIGDGSTHWNQLPYLTEDPDTPPDLSDLIAHIYSDLPHPVYDDGPSLTIIYENAKV